MADKIFLLVLALLIFIFVSPSVRKLFQVCQHPIWRQPVQQLPYNVFVLMTLCFGLTVIYGITGGGVTFLVRQLTPTQEILRTGALIGAFLFATARTMALTQTQAFAQSLYFSGIVATSAFLAYGLYHPSSWTGLTDDIAKGGVDDLSLAPFCLVVSLIAVVVSEGLTEAFDRFFSGTVPIPFSLVREQLESFEGHLRGRGEEQMTRLLENELLEARIEGVAGEEIVVGWMSANASLRVRQALERATQEVSHPTKRPQFRIRVLCHDSDENRKRLANFEVGDIRFFETAGHMRLILVGQRVALLGVQMGIARHELFPDYVVVIREPIRIAKLKALFDECWNLSKIDDTNSAGAD